MLIQTFFTAIKLPEVQFLQCRTKYLAKRIEIKKSPPSTPRINVDEWKRFAILFKLVSNTTQHWVGGRRGFRSDLTLKKGKKWTILSDIVGSEFHNGKKCTLQTASHFTNNTEILSWKRQLQYVPKNINILVFAKENKKEFHWLKAWKNILRPGHEKNFFHLADFQKQHFFVAFYKRKMYL